MSFSSSSPSAVGFVEISSSFHSFSSLFFTYDSTLFAFNSLGKSFNAQCLTQCEETLFSYHFILHLMMVSAARELCAVCATRKRRRGTRVKDREREWERSGAEWVRAYDRNWGCHFPVRNTTDVDVLFFNCLHWTSTGWRKSGRQQRRQEARTDGYKEKKRSRSAKIVLYARWM